MSKTVVALFENTSKAQHAVEALKAQGFLHEPIEVQRGDEFLRKGNVPLKEPAREGLYRGIRAFFEEIGLANPHGPREGEYQTIAPAEAVIVLETSDERADTAAEVLDREGAINVEERIERGARPDEAHLASGLEPRTSGRTPPDTREVAPHQDIDERTLATYSTADPTKPRRASRIYAPVYEPMDDGAPKGPDPYKH